MFEQRRFEKHIENFDKMLEASVEPFLYPVLNNLDVERNTGYPNLGLEYGPELLSEIDLLREDMMFVLDNLDGLTLDDRFLISDICDRMEEVGCGRGSRISTMLISFTHPDASRYCSPEAAEFALSLFTPYENWLRQAQAMSNELADIRLKLF